MIAVHPGLVVGVITALIMLVGLLAFLVDAVIRLQAALHDDTEADHDACLARVMLEMSDWHTANRIRYMADSYGTAEGREIMNAAQRKWRLEGEPLPVLWIREYADSIYPTDQSGAIPEQFRDYVLTEEHS